jgi:hypothetical protein
LPHVSFSGSVEQTLAAYSPQGKPPTGIGGPLPLSETSLQNRIQNDWSIMTKAKATPTPAIPLPAGILASDLVYPDGTRKDQFDPRGRLEDRLFGLWYTERFGWCIPTLPIRGAGRQATPRTYGYAIRDRQLVSLGRGPHVKATHTVYVKASRADALKPFLDLRDTGLEKAGEYRDGLSSRRAQTSLRRSMMGGGAWFR